MYIIPSVAFPTHAPSISGFPWLKMYNCDITAVRTKKIDKSSEEIYEKYGQKKKPVVSNFVEEIIYLYLQGQLA